MVRDEEGGGQLERRYNVLGVMATRSVGGVRWKGSAKWRLAREMGGIGQGRRRAWAAVNLKTFVEDIKAGTAVTNGYFVACRKGS